MNATVALLHRFLRLRHGNRNAMKLRCRRHYLYQIIVNSTINTHDPKRQDHPGTHPPVLLLRQSTNDAGPVLLSEP